jgi:DNA repair protein RecN (Recombination protein N)
MLRRLYISNFALINEMDVAFPGKLSVITGETGAGKSIFLEALALALGKRADITALQNKSKKCIIEAEFTVSNLNLYQFFLSHELDEEPQIILRREISAEGKSRSFLNDTPVSLSVLKELSEYIIDIHSQHQTLLLNQSNFQLEIVDAFAGTLNEYQKFKTDFLQLNKLKKNLTELITSETQAKKELDYYNFLYTELQETEIHPGLLKELEEKSLALENAEFIKSGLLNVAAAIQGGDQNLLGSLSLLKHTLQGITKFGNTYQEFFARLNSAYVELKELANDMEDAEGKVNFDSEKLSIVNTALDKINRLLKKHGVKSEEELLKSKADIEEKLNSFSSLEIQVQKINSKIVKLEKQCAEQAAEISKSRKKAIPEIEKRVKEFLSDLAIPSAQFKIQMNWSEQLSVYGFDHVQFLFSANKGGTLNELQKAASGGELSRLMLSLKALLAEKKELPTIIFDEIDTGVSGDVADKIGTILSKMGINMQVITITHLPQIASKGAHHLFVYKKDEEDRTSSFIRELDEESRIVEIAKMLSTGNPSSSALKNAKELLSL